MIVSLRNLLFAACVAAFAVDLANAAPITVSDAGGSGTVTNAQDGSTFGPATIAGYAPGGNALVVVTTSESVFNHSVTYGGVPLTLGAAGFREAGGLPHQQANVWYLLDPAASGDLVILGDAHVGGGTSGFGYAYMGLDGVGSVASSGDVDSASGGSILGVSYTTDYDGGFVVVGAANNANVPDPGPANDFPLYDSGNAATLLLQQEIVNSLGGSGHYAAYGAVATAGAYEERIGGMNTSRNTVALVAFNPVPEPTTVALLGLGALAATTLRRRG